MWVVKATVIGTAVVSGMMLAGVRNDVPSRAEATNPPVMSQAVKRLGPLINEPGRTDRVADGFETAEDFAAAVHAARNIKVPFTELKYQIVHEGKSLPAAIQTLKPAANTSLEADLARSEARADLSAIR